MTVYFDHINYTNRVSSSFDPANEWFSFLYYKLLDWTSKIGTTKAEVLTGVPEWTAGTEAWNNNSTIYLQLALYADDVRDGSYTSQYWQGLTWEHQSTSYLYVKNDTILKSATRSSRYGYLPSSYANNIRSEYRHLYGTNLTRGYQLAVCYGDTPGKEFFAISDSQESTGHGINGVIAKVTPRPGMPAGHGTGWASFNSTNAFVWSRDVQQSGVDPLSGTELQYTSTGYGGFGHKSTANSPYLYRNIPLVSVGGYWVATAENIAHAIYPRRELSIVQTPDAKQYLHWKGGVHIDVTGENGVL